MIEEAELERIAALGWRALHVERLGDWLLRDSAGFTQRGNSCLPLGDPGLPLDEAVSVVEGWYAARGRPAMFQVPLRAAAVLDEQLARARWAIGDEVVVSVGEITTALDTLPLPSEPSRLVVDPAPDARWLAAYHYRGGGPVPPEGVEVLTLGDVLGFVSVLEGDDVVAIARGSVDESWLGVFAVEVAESVRRRGLGTQVMRGLLEWAKDKGAQQAYLQVAVENEAARRMYARQGFAEHHRYRYRKLRSLR